MTRERLLELFTYRDGNLYWIKRNQREVGHKDKRTGYIQVRVDKRLYPLHRLIFLFHTGKYEETIDHINRIKEDNRIENLRPCTKSQNEANTTHRKTNKLKEKHISFNCGSYSVRIHRKNLYISRRFKSIVDAIIFRDKMLMCIDEEFYFAERD